jgi:membrane protein
VSPARSWELVKVAFVGWWNDRALSMGAAIAYYTIFSLAPVLLVVTAIAGLVFGPEAARGAIVRELGGLIGERAAEAVEAMIQSASNIGSGILSTAVGVLTFLLLLTGALVELQDDLNQIWKVKPAERSTLWTFIRSRLLSLALVVAFGFVLMVSLALDAALTALGSYPAGFLPSLPAILRAANFILSLVVTTMLFALIFKVLPDVDLAWRDVWAGAVVTALLFAVGKLLIGLYIGKSGVASAYGAAGSIVLILLWVYYSSQILLFGAELTKAFAERHGSRRLVAAVKKSEGAEIPGRPRV